VQCQLQASTAIVLARFCVQITRIHFAMTDSRAVKPIFGLSRSWLFALIALLSARHWGRLLQSLASALERYWPMLVDKAILIERLIRHWRVNAARVLGLVASSLVTVGLDAAGRSAVSTSQSVSDWQAMVCKEIALSLYAWCASCSCKRDACFSV
jgi:hypothetical protein